MKRILSGIFFISVATLFTLACSRVETYSLVPSPEKISGTGEVCRVAGELGVFSADSALRSVAIVWAGSMQGAVLPSVCLTGGREDAQLFLSQNPDLQKEAYRLSIKRKGIEIAGGGPEGVFRGLQSLSQILLQAETGTKGERLLRGTVVEDSPKYAHRGGLLDCCRYFYSVEEVKAFIDILAAHKMNVFHWHLTDDQGWRIEIRKYPRLTEVGSVRRATVVGRHSKKEEENVYDGIPYGPYFYTQEQVREVVQYAADRFITVIPEIEMPGHCLGAIAAYPWLSCDGKPKEVSPRWGVFAEGVVCPSRESTYRFLEDVLDEVCELFPSEYIHIGGDEAPRSNWESCPNCQNKMREKGFTREAELQRYLLDRIGSYLAEKGRRIIGWDEILDGGAPQSVTVMCWRGVKWGQEAARLGNRVIMTPRQYCYLDYYQTEDPAGNGEKMAPLKHFLPMEQCYSLDPAEGLEPEEAERIIGLQGNVWCEFISSFDHVQFMALPRLAALCEVAWSKEKSDYEGFLSRLRAAMLPVYEYHGWVYAPYEFQ